MHYHLHRAIPKSCIELLCSNITIHMHFPSPPLSLSLSTGINETSAILMNVSDTTQELQMAGNTLTTTLDDIADDIDALRAACVAVVTLDCSGIPPTNSFQAGTNYDDVSCVAHCIELYVIRLPLTNPATRCVSGTE